MVKQLIQEYNRVFDNITTYINEEKESYLEELKKDILDRDYIHDLYQEWLNECSKMGDYGLTSEDCDTLKEFYYFMNDNINEIMKEAK